MPSLLLLGRDYSVYGDVEAVTVGPHVAAAISVGADPRSPSLEFKGDPDVRNEDALCVVVDGERTAMAVADAHYGPEASHVLIEQLHDRWQTGVPADPTDLLRVVDVLGADPLTESETALVAVVHDRSTGRGFGVSIGDTSVCLVGPGHTGEALNDRDHTYVTAEGTAAGAGADVVAFQFETQPGDVIMAFTDGIDECHYRHPETSITPEHLVGAVSSAGQSATAIARRVCDLALAGVDSYPGGQDNIALVVCLA